MSEVLDVLVVEDEVETRFLISQILAVRGYTVRTAEDGFHALSMIRCTIPDILLSDLNMPGMSGFELLSVVRRLYPGIRVIATSGAYPGTHVPIGIAADAFYEKASGMARLFDLLEAVASAKDAMTCSKRLPTPHVGRPPTTGGHRVEPCPDQLPSVHARFSRSHRTGEPGPLCDAMPLLR